MKKILTALLTCILLSSPAISQETANEHSKRKPLNFFVVSKPKKGKLDPASRFNILRTGIRSLFHKKFVSIVATDAAQMSAKVRRKLKRHHANIGTIWFDSHGLYKSGHALFYVGHDEFSYKNINDSNQTQALQELVPFCTTGTKVVIGSCYGGATFNRKANTSSDSMRMNGDSLMIGLSATLHGVTVYGSESWVMTKPGLFRKKNAVAGFPTRKIFRDIIYRPAWQHVGVWNVYAPGSQFRQIPPVTMDKHGNVLVKPFPYLSKDKFKKKVANKMSKLQPGLLKA